LISNFIEPFLQSVSRLGWADLLDELLVFTERSVNWCQLHVDASMQAFFRPFALYLLTNDVFRPSRLSELPEV
jgi:hypothetical protein